MFEVDYPKKVLLDYDILLYQVGAVMWEHPFIPGEKDPAPRWFVKKQIEFFIKRCTEVSMATEFNLFITGANNFRFDIAKQVEYKGNRKDIEKPANHGMVKNIAAKHYGRHVVNCTGYEADDAMAYHRFEKDANDYIICTRDKDLLTVPGWHYRWICGEDQPERLPHFVSVFEANRFFFHQCLTGDPTDNIVGCGKKESTYWGSRKKVDAILDYKGKSKAAKNRFIDRILERALKNPSLARVVEKKYGIEQVVRRSGVGPAEATKILDQCDCLGSMEEAVREHYRALFGDAAEEVLLENARLLYMGQSPTLLFEWDWFDGLRHITAETEYNTKETEWQYRQIHKEKQIES